MKEEFIPYEQALALKELGFDGGCFSLYFNNGEFSNFIHAYKVNDEVVEKTNSVLAPTFSQAFRWFREKYDLFTQDFIDLDNKFTKNIVKVLKNGQDFFYLDYYKTYEEAELKCLKKLIEIAKTWKK